MESSAKNKHNLLCVFPPQEGHTAGIRTGFSGGAFPKDTIYLLNKYLQSKMGGGRAFQRQNSLNKAKEEGKPGVCVGSSE